MFTLGEDPEPKLRNVFIGRMFFVPKAFRLSGQQNCPRKCVKHRMPISLSLCEGILSSKLAMFSHSDAQHLKFAAVRGLNLAG